MIAPPTSQSAKEVIATLASLDPSRTYSWTCSIKRHYSWSDHARGLRSHSFTDVFVRASVHAHKCQGQVSILVHRDGGAGFTIIEDVLTHQLHDHERHDHERRPQ